MLCTAAPPCSHPTLALQGQHPAGCCPATNHKQCPSEENSWKNMKTSKKKSSKSCALLAAERAHPSQGCVQAQIINKKMHQKKNQACRVEKSQQEYVQTRCVVQRSNRRSRLLVDLCKKGRHFISSPCVTPKCQRIALYRI